jgi:hypothetical protein
MAPQCVSTLELTEVPDLAPPLRLSLHSGERCPADVRVASSSACLHRPDVTMCTALAGASPGENLPASLVNRGTELSFRS